MPIWAKIGKMQKGSLDKEWEEECTMQRTLDAKSLKQKRAQSIESRPKSPNDQQSEQKRDKNSFLYQIFWGSTVLIIEHIMKNKILAFM